MMYFYEIRNTKTQENGRGIAKNFAEICKSKGWRPQDCRCVWKAGVEAAYQGRLLSRPPQTFRPLISIITQPQHFVKRKIEKK